MINDVRVINLPRIHDPRGNLTFIQSDTQVDFDIKRIYYLYDVPGGESRAGHALKTTHQLLIAVSGSFDVNLDDGTANLRVSLNRSHLGLYIPPFVWRTIDNFSSGAVCLAVVSTLYDPDDYIRDHPTFLNTQAGRA